MTERAETGPVSFGDDWPGVFFRGDDAHGYAVAIEQIGDWLDADPRPTGDILLARQRLEALELLLLSSNHKTSVELTQLRPWAACTEGGRPGLVGVRDAGPPRDRAALATAVTKVSSALDEWLAGEPDEKRLRELRPEMKKFFDLLIAMLEVSGR